MSVFTSHVTKRVEIPHDAGAFVVLRKLAPKHLDAAAKSNQRQSLDDLNALGGPAILKAIREMESDAKKPIEEIAKAAVKSDPLTSFDRIVLMQKGITSWSYDAPLTVESFEDLDDETAAFLAGEVLKLAKPSLYQTKAEAEADQKNG